MSCELIDLGHGFWSIRGSFRVFGMVDIGTQAALVQLPSGGFVMLDSYALEGEARARVLAMTDNGRSVEAIYNLHPFHSVHCETTATLFPQARLFGTSRHKRLYPALDWQEATTDQAAAWTGVETELDSSVPAGVDFISADEHVHFSSVIVRHRPSATVHVDDTFMAGILPGPLKLLTGGDRLDFHPTLASALEKRAGAASDFRNWAHSLAAEWNDVRHVCAAHNTVLHVNEGAFSAQVLAALERVSGKLEKHEARYG